MVSPVEGHVSSVLEDIVIRVAHDTDVAISRLALLDEAVERRFRVGRVASDGRGDLLIDYDVDLDTSLSGTLQDLVEAPFLIEVGRTSQEKLRADPPVGEVDRFLGALECNRDSMEVVTSVNVPLDIVAVALRGERLEAMLLGDGSPLGISPLLVLLVVTVVRIDQVLELANAVLEMNSADLDVVQVGIFELVPELAHKTLALTLDLVSLLASDILRSALLIGADVRGSPQDHDGGVVRVRRSETRHVLP